MPNQTTLPTRPGRTEPLTRQVSTIWQMLTYFINAIYDSFVGKFASGLATVTSGNTTVAVVHGLGAGTYSVALTPVIDPGGRFWISGKTSSQFTINLQVAAPGGGITFDWMVKAA